MIDWPQPRLCVFLAVGRVRVLDAEDDGRWLETISFKIAYKSELKCQRRVCYSLKRVNKDELTTARATCAADVLSVIP